MVCVLDGSLIPPGPPLAPTHTRRVALCVSSYICAVFTAFPREVRVCTSCEEVASKQYLPHVEQRVFRQHGPQRALRDTLYRQSARSKTLICVVLYKSYC